MTRDHLDRGLVDPTTSKVTSCRTSQVVEEHLPDAGFLARLGPVLVKSPYGRPGCDPLTALAIENQIRNGNCPIGPLVGADGKSPTDDLAIRTIEHQLQTRTVLHHRTR